jgi:hypothetical protein
MADSKVLAAGTERDGALNKGKGDQKYDESPRGYLSRARDRLLSDDRAELFYAALELRLFVEARQDAYAQAQKRYLRSVPRAYKIGSQAAALRKLFNRDEILRLDFDFFDVPPITVYYTPVTSELKNFAEKLGDLLHVSDDTRDDTWWAETKSKLLKVYRCGWIACRGELLSPLLLDRSGHCIGAIEFPGPRNNVLFDGMNDGVERICKITVDYLKSTPPDFVPDI